MNSICRDEAHVLSGRLPVPTQEVAKDLDAGRITPAAAAFLGRRADAFLSVPAPPRERMESIRASRSDRTVLRRYEQVTDRALVSLRSVQKAVARKDFAAAGQDWRRFQQASQENSDLNAELRLSACGTLQSPAAS